MNRDIRADVIVVGAGAVGLSSAIALARQGVGVAILERGEVGREASWAGGGILSPLPPWNYRDEVTALTIRSEAMWPEWVDYLAERTGRDVEYTRCGMLLLPDYEQEKAFAWAQVHAVPLQAVEARRRVPSLAYDGPALLLPDVAQVRNPRLLAALRACAEGLGIAIHEHTEVIGWRVAAGRVVAVETGRGAFSAGQYLVCGGTWSRLLCGEHALGLDIRPVRGQMLLFRAEPGLLDAIVLANGNYLIQRRDGLVLAGTTREDVDFDQSTTAEARASILAFAHGLLPALGESNLVRHWAGLRPGSPDNIPTIARHPEIGNLYLNGGHFSYGVTMAPVCAERVAEVVLGKELEIGAYGWPVSVR